MISEEQVAFLRARLDEDAVIAQGAARTDDGHHGGWLPVHFGAGGFDARVDDHIARHDPVRVLREVEIKRQRLERCLAQDGYDLPQGVHEGRDPDERACGEALRDALEDEVRGDAAAYSDHPDYGKLFG
jgi:hypothetical protein